jgi:hypothetical protein
LFNQSKTEKVTTKQKIKFGLGTSKAMSEKLARLRCKLNQQLGPETPASFIIKGPNGKYKKNNFDRTKVKYEE